MSFASVWSSLFLLYIRIQNNSPFPLPPPVFLPHFLLALASLIAAVIDVYFGTESFMDFISVLHVVHIVHGLFIVVVHRIRKPLVQDWLKTLLSLDICFIIALFFIFHIIIVAIRISCYTTILFYGFIFASLAYVFSIKFHFDRSLALRCQPFRYSCHS